ncbi:aspartyl-phosphate phosphatase Spo0E family protein [Cytobacillus suaedae]|nr:aspartyl-phosphate phosphatase Spo0E family protein [Cytobacillus suaedae]
MLRLIIEAKRIKMITLAQEYGFTAKETIQCSQELDKLLNLYGQAMESQESSNTTPAAKSVVS